METPTKTCSCCGMTFPKTEEYFYRKVTKAGTMIKGHALKHDSVSLRHTCKKCNSRTHYKNQLISKKKLKRMQELGITTETQWHEYVLESKRAASRKGADAVKKAPPVYKYDYPPGLSRNERERFRVILRKGYNYETYDKDWKTRWLSNMAKRRVLQYPENSTRRERAKLLYKHKRIALVDSIITNALGFHLNEVPKDLIELKRKQLKLYRDVKAKQHRQSQKKVDSHWRQSSK